MAWFLNHYECYRCGRAWEDEWSCMCDDECPYCGARDASPVTSEDLTNIYIEEQSEFVVLRSPETAEDKPRYAEVARFPTAELAAKFVAESNLSGDD